MDQKEYLDTMEDLFGHPGWRLVEADARREIYELQADSLDKALTKTWDDVNVKRGRAEALNELILLPDIVANKRKAMEDEAGK